MKDFHLRFTTDWFDYLDDLLEKDILSIPERDGAYILGATDGTMFTYPWGSSPVFYIGKADNLRKRLADHRKYIKGAQTDHEKINWWPRYQYGAAFGAAVAFYLCQKNKDPNDLEAELINDFYYQYGSIPTANGAWPKGIKEPENGEQSD